MATLFFLLIGCDEIDALFGGLTDTDVAEGLVVGVRTPADLDLSDTEYANGGRAAAYLTRLGEGPPDADLALLSPSNGRMSLVHEREGVWATDAEAGLTYVPGETFVLQRDGSEILRADAAPAAVVSVPSSLAFGATLPLSAEGQDFDALIAVVLDLSTREETWTNSPQEAGVAYQMLVEDAVLSVEIPAGAFPAPGAYAVGVAGLQANAPDEVTDVNTLASLLGTGLLEFRTVTVE